MTPWLALAIGFISAVLIYFHLYACPLSSTPVWFLTLGVMLTDSAKTDLLRRGVPRKSLTDSR